MRREKKRKKERNTAKITVDKSRFKQSYQQQKYMKLIEKKCVTMTCGNNVASALSVIVTDSECRQGEHCILDDSTCMIVNWRLVGLWATIKMCTRFMMSYWTSILFNHLCVQILKNFYLMLHRITQFTPHSFRSASSSAMLKTGVHLDCYLSNV